MNTGLLIHGTCDNEEYFSDEYPSLSNSHWLPWLQKQMLMKHIETQTPEMPKAYAPNYDAWKTTFEQFPVNEESILVGHSCGGGFLLRYFSENKIKTKRIILVAPWLNPLKETDEEVIGKDPNFFDFEIDPTLMGRTDLHMFYSDNDMKSIQVSVDIIRKSIPDIQSREFKSYGHFCFGDMGTDAFPELLETVLKA